MIGTLQSLTIIGKNESNECSSLTQVSYLLLLDFFLVLKLNVRE